MSTATSEWVFRKRDYDLERKKLKTECASTSEHPLRGTVVMSVTGSNVRGNNTKQTALAAKSKTMTDPLSIISASDSFDGTDPLSMLAHNEDPIVPATTLSRRKNDKNIFGDAEGYIDQTFEPWADKKADILARYTTSEKLTISTSFLSDNDKEKLTIKQQVTATDKVKTRLEQLDDFEEGSVKEMLNLSQAEYVNRIEQLNSTLLSAWGADQRVKSLKIAIQCAKLIGDISVLQFYPSQFVLITDILDNFGRLVFERIRDKSITYSPASNVPKTLPENFTPEEVPETAKETCRNWFYKVSSIRELIPRLYVEMAILKCYSFLTTGEYSQALVRLAHQIRGIADPLVAVYARCYLCRVGIHVAPQVRDHLNPCWFDYLSTYNQIKDSSIQDRLAKQSIAMPSYVQLFSPALDWLLQCIAYKASESTLTKILEKCKSCNSALIMNSVMSAFDPKYIASRAIDFIDLIKESEDSGLPKYLLYKSLGVTLSLEDPPEESRLTILNDVWKAVMKMKNPVEYMSCAEIWIEYPVKFFTVKEVNTLLGNIIKHMSPDRAFENHYFQLLSIISKVLTSSTVDFNTIFMMDNFLPFLDMFQKESLKVEACKEIMIAYNKTATELSDTVIINALKTICKTLHDSISAISLQDERRSIAKLVSSFLLSVSFGKDFEQLLNFFVDARAAFSNIDEILIMLVHNVNLLAVKTKLIVKGNHTRKTSAFIRACMAFSFITIPSMSDIFIRLKLYLLCGQTALSNQAVGQADAFFKAAVTLLADVPKQINIDSKMRSSEQYFVEYINNLMSTLLIVPDNPEQGVVYLLYGLLNVLQDYIWDDDSDSKVKIFLNAVCLLSAFCQESYVYQVYKVDSNDKLYGAGQKFIAEIEKVINRLIPQIFELLKEIGANNLKKQSALALSFVNRIISHANLNDIAMVKLALNLWRLSLQHGQADKKFMKTMKDFIERRTQTDKGSQDLLRAINSLVQPS